MLDILISLFQCGSYQICTEFSY